MIRFMLDTNACIAVLNGSPASVRSRLLKNEPSECVISQVVHVELVYGAFHSQSPKRNLARIERLRRYVRVMPWEEEAALASAQIQNDLAAIGRPIGPYDTMIAGHAVAQDAILVSHNTREFGRVGELKLEDWEE